MRPAFRIIADGTDATAAFADRLVSIEVQDETGETADTATITLDDRDHRVALPRVGARLEIALGFDGALTQLGTFAVEDLSGTLFPATLSLTASAADLRAALKAPRTRAWEGLTLGEIARTIAADHALTPRIAPDIAAEPVGYRAQTAESDMNFLTRLAREVDAIAKPAGGALVLVRAGGGTDADGRTLSPVPIDASQMSEADWRLDARGVYGRVTAEWTDRAAATTRRVTVGEAEPEQLLRARFQSEAEANRAAARALDRARRNGGTFTVRLAGFHANLFAGAPVALTGVKPELAGVWTLDRVTHRLSGALTTEIVLKRAVEVTHD